MNLVIYDNGLYKITKEGLELLEQGEFRVHWVKAIFTVSRVNLEKVIEHAHKDSEMRGDWIAYYVDLRPYAPATAQINVSKNDEITILLHIDEFKAKNDVDAKVKAFNKVMECLKALLYLEIIPTVFALELRDILWKSDSKVYGHYAVKLPDDFPVEGNYEEVRFGRPATDLQGKKLDFEAKALIDKSKGYPEMEFNDKTFFERLCYTLDRLPQDLQQLKILLMGINGTLDKAESTIKRFNDFLQTFDEKLKDYEKFKRLEEETYSKFLEANKAMAMNIEAHIPYVQNASAFLEHAIKIQEQQYKEFNELIKGQKELINKLHKELEEKERDIQKLNNSLRKQKLFTLFVSILLILVLILEAITWKGIGL